MKMTSISTLAFLTVCTIAEAQNQTRQQNNPPARERSVQKIERRGTRVEGEKRVESRSTTRILTSSVVIGAPVTLVAGTRLGTVQEFVINDGGCIDYVVVKYENRFVPIPWSVARFNAEERVILLDIDEPRLQQIPTYTQINELNNVEFVRQVNTFYRVDERREHRAGKPAASNRGSSRVGGEKGREIKQRPRPDNGDGSQEPNRNSKAGKNAEPQSKESDSSKNATKEEEKKKEDEKK